MFDKLYFFVIIQKKGFKDKFVFMRQVDIITIGECLLELSASETLSETYDFIKYFGGDALCSSVCASRLGSNVGFITKIGNDFFEKFLYKKLKDEKLDTLYVKTVNAINGVYFVGKDECFKNEVQFYRKKSAASYLSIDDINEDYFKEASVYYATGTTQALSVNAREAVSQGFLFAKKNSLICAYDPNFNRTLWSEAEAKDAFDEIISDVDILFLNIDKDVKTIYNIESIDSVIKYFWDQGVQSVVIKSLVDSGYFIGYNNEILFVKFFAATKDAFGAGDAFNGAFLHAINKGFSYYEAGKFASIVAGLQAQKSGAIKSIPLKEEVCEYYGC